MLTPSRPGNPNHDTIIAILKTLKKPFEEFTPKELQKRFPEARFGELGYRAYIDSSAGLLTADKALKCFQVNERVNCTVKRISVRVKTFDLYIYWQSKRLLVILRKFSEKLAIENKYDPAVDQ